MNIKQSQVPLEQTEHTDQRQEAFKTMLNLMYMVAKQWSEIMGSDGKAEDFVKYFYTWGHHKKIHNVSEEHLSIARFKSMRGQRQNRGKRRNVTTSNKLYTAIASGHCHTTSTSSDCQKAHYEVLVLFCLSVQNIHTA